jgi:hypothetical protein
MPAVVENLHLVEFLNRPAEVLHACIMYPPDLIGRRRMSTSICSHRNSGDIEFHVIERHVEEHCQESVGARLICLPEGDVLSQGRLISEASSVMYVVRNETLQVLADLNPHLEREVLVGAIVQFRGSIVGVEGVEASLRDWEERWICRCRGGPATTIIRGACILSRGACRAASHF